MRKTIHHTVHDKSTCTVAHEYIDYKCFWGRVTEPGAKQGMVPVEFDDPAVRLSMFPCNISLSKPSPDMVCDSDT